MRKILLLAGVAAAVLQGPSFSLALAQEQQGVAVAIIYDTSGSMRDPVRDSKTKSSAPKYVIANRALIRIARQIETFGTGSKGTPRRIEAGLFTFESSEPHEAIKLGPFSSAAFQEFARNFSSPGGNTPLGQTLSEAWKRVMQSPLSRKHILVITDGINTSGPAPGVVLPKLQKQAEAKQTVVGVHFVAFDIDAKVFDSVKKQGATVVGASDEEQLNTRLQAILQQKILLEDEEPKKQ
jgi:hypothetical protein